MRAAKTKRSLLSNEEKKMLAEYHNRPRVILDKPMRLAYDVILRADVKFEQPLCHVPLCVPCMQNDSQAYHFSQRFPAYFPRRPGSSTRRETVLESFEESVEVTGDLCGGSSSPWCRNIERLFFRCCCLRCSIAQQRNILYHDAEERRLLQRDLCCDNILVDPRRYCLSVCAIACCDLFTGGLPLPCCYYGLGTALYGWRIRYEIRLRYGVDGSSMGDFFAMLLCPMLTVDQLSTEIERHGLHEEWTPFPAIRSAYEII